MPVNFPSKRPRPRLASLFLFVAALGFLFAAAQRPAATAETSGAPAAVVIRFRENFDAVAAPQLPAGWTTAATGAGVPFATVTNIFDSAPNAAFAPSTAAAGASALVSPPVVMTGTQTTLNFRHRYSMENTWDGGVLEMKIGDGPFADVVVAGGVFLAGGYTTALNPSANPLEGRSAWSGASQGVEPVSVRLPASVFGQAVQFRWRLGSNESFAVDGWWIDSVTIENNPTGANQQAITIPSAGVADPYPSQIQIAGLSGLVTGVTLNLENFSHASPDDVDLMLVAPDGRRVVVMSDVGGATPVVNLSLTLTDAAAGNLPDNGPLVSGLYRPTNADAADAFPAPAPPGAPSGSAFGAFYGTNPNGAWSLYLVDDSGANAGAVAGGWNLDLQASVNACLFSLTPNALAFPAAGGAGSFQINTPLNCGWTVSTASSFITINSPTSGTSSRAVDFTVAANAGAARTGTISVSDGINVRTFQVQQGSGCPLALGQTTLDFGAAGGAANVSVTAAANCTWQASTGADWISVASTPQSGNGAAGLSVSPNPSRAPRTGVVTIGARALVVNQAGRATAAFDFDADGRSDLSVYRDGTWYLQQSTNGFAAVSFGLAADRLAPADYDGDGKTDLAVYRAGTWYVLQSGSGQVFVAPFGLATDVPVPADYTGDGRAELAVYRDGFWYTFDLAAGQTRVVAFGLAGDRPVAADYDGDGKTDPAVYRDGTWYLQRSTEGFAAVQFGLAADRPVTGDYDGDGRADLAVYRGGAWHVLTNFQNYTVTAFGLASDAPVAADYDGDGRTDLAVYRAGVWYVLRSTNAQFFAAPFGLASDRPVPAAFTP